jgi:hypothetical protein
MGFDIARATRDRTDVRRISAVRAKQTLKLKDDICVDVLRARTNFRAIP